MNDTLLIIEDNEQNFYMMRFLLEKNGFKVIGAGNGREGIEQALRRKPRDCIAGHTLADPVVERKGKVDANRRAVISFK